MAAETGATFRKVKNAELSCRVTSSYVAPNPYELNHQFIFSTNTFSMGAVANWLNDEPNSK